MRQQPTPHARRTMYQLERAVPLTRRGVRYFMLSRVHSSYSRSVHNVRESHSEHRVHSLIYLYRISDWYCISMPYIRAAVRCAPGVVSRCPRVRGYYEVLPRSIDMLVNTRTRGITRMTTDLEKFVRFPHAVREALEGDVYGWYRRAPHELLLVRAQDRESDTEEDVDAIDHEDIPHTEQGLHTHYQRLHPLWQADGRTSTGRQSVKSERNQEKQIAPRSTPSSVRCADSFGMRSCT